MSIFRRLLNVFRTDRLARDARREVDFHIAECIDELVDSGMSETEARREARRRFGHTDDVKADVHRAEVLGWLDAVFTDIRYALRGLRANPGFTAVAVVSLGLGIGANTAIFSLVNAVILRSLPVWNPQDIVQVTLGGSRGTFTVPLWDAVREQQEALDGVLAHGDQTFNLADGGVVRRETGAWVSGGYFNVLGVPPAVGRVFSPSDDVRGCPAVAVLGHRFWQREYGGDEAVVGRTISLNGNPFEIVGVSASGFEGVHVGRTANIFTPICAADIFYPGRNLLDARSSWYISILGRLPRGGSLEEAQASLAATARGVMEASVPTHWAPDEQAEFLENGLSARAASTGLSIVRGQYRTALFTLLVVVGVVLLIACANVAQLLMARATARQHEVAVRLAIGSGRARLIRQLLTESALLALLGAALGVVFARWSSGLIVAFLRQGGSTVSLDLSLDLRVLGFTVLVATLTGILFGLAPAWRSSRVSPQRAMRGSGRGLVGDSRHLLGRSIVVGQVALSLVLVVAAGLLVGSFQRLSTIDPGFTPAGVLLVETGWSALDLSEDNARVFPRELVERMESIPGVVSASASLTTPISGASWNDYVVFDDMPRGGDLPLVYFNGVTEDYLRTLEMRLVAGRGFDASDRDGSAPVAIVNEELARQFFGGENPVGRTMRTSSHDSLSAPIEIVGLLADSKYRRLDEETLPTALVPLEQAGLWGSGVHITVRSSGAPTAVQPAVTEAMRQIHPAITLEFSTLEANIAESLARPKLLATMSGFFGGLALLLAVIGLYGTMAYNVTRRRNEMGVRIALGAPQARILGLIAGEAGRIVAGGLVLGALLAFAATRLIASFLYGVGATDPMTMAGSALMLALVAMGAALLPAWRAARVDPMVTLRDE